ncbi:MAG: phenylalanine--tRNA ligase subunit alpha [Sumerlaeia bacterium]
MADFKKLTPLAQADFASADDMKALDEARIEWLGKKGKLADMNRRFKELPQQEIPIAGKILNQHKAQIIRLEKERREELEAKELEQRLVAEAIDVTMPGAAVPLGHMHPLLQTRRQVEGIFRNMGFRIVEGPEIESEWVNFDALNIASDHPARDMQDTFFTDRGRVLRTHTSGNQIRTMMTGKPPMAVISTGRVYRCDSDPTHSPMFMQMEGFLVDRNVSMAHLKGVLMEFVHALYGPDTAVQFRPSFFPFTEPSAEVDIGWNREKGGAAKVGDPDMQWMEILGCGMIHPNVLKNCGIDPEEWTGFAFGLGIDRIAMLKYGIKDIRLLYENDLRFLTQF